jgi:hypothetical protein
MITHSLEIPMNYVARVEKVKAFSDITYLMGGISVRSNTTQLRPTRPSRSALGFFLMYSVRSPPGIQAEISWRGLEVIPRSGTMVLCSKCFHTTASW